MNSQAHSSQAHSFQSHSSRAHKVLEDILANGIDVHRCAAARAFATIGGAGAVASLIPALLDEDPDVRVDAAQSLGAIGDPAAAKPLMENLLGDPESDVKKAALQALIDFGHAPLVPLLRKLSISRCDDIAWDESEFYSDGWDSWLDLQMIAIRGLARFGPPEAVSDILTAMGDEQGQDVSEVGVAALATMGLDGAVALEQLFPISDVRLQRRIADVVMRADNPHLKGMTDIFLAAPSARVREVATSGLDPADPRLDGLFSDGDGGVRAAVVRRAGRGFSERIKALIPDPDPTVRVEVFKAIAEQPDDYRDEDLIEAVKKAISGEPKAAKQAALALIALSGAEAVKGLTHVMSNTKVLLEFRVGAVEALEAAGPVSAPHLLKAARDDQRELRLAAMTALAGLAANDPVWPNVAGEGLISALNGMLIAAPVENDEDPDEPLEAEVAEVAEIAEIAKQDLGIDDSTPLVAVRDDAEGSTLGKILSDSSASPDMVEPEEVELSEQDIRFLELSKQRKMSKRKMSLESDIAPYLDVRRFAAAVLGQVANAQVTDALIAVLGDDDKELAEDALNALVQHGETIGTLPLSASAPLLQYFSAADPGTRRVLALRAIAKLKSGAAETLQDALSDSDPLIRVEAVRGLGHLGHADQETEAALQDSYVGVAIAASRALARIRGDQAVEPLIEFAFRNDGTYRRDIGQLLGEYAPEAGISRLIDLASDDEHLRERLVVIDALAEALARAAQNKSLKVA